MVRVFKYRLRAFCRRRVLSGGLYCNSFMYSWTINAQKHAYNRIYEAK